MVYNDISAIWNVNETYSLSVGVSNAFDEEPEQVQLGIDMYTDPGPYDVVGQYWYATLRGQF